MTAAALPTDFSDDLLAEMGCAAVRNCEHCGKAFEPRNGSGGKAQRFCAPECRTAFHTAQRSQRGPTYNARAGLPAVITAPKTAPADSDKVLVGSQDEITFSFNEAGDLILTQRAWPDDDAVILVNATNIDQFIDKLTDALGIPSAGQ